MSHKILSLILLAFLLLVVNSQTPPNWGATPRYTV
jgi:hypothetical protein